MRIGNECWIFIDIVLGHVPGPIKVDCFTLKATPTVRKCQWICVCVSIPFFFIKQIWTPSSWHLDLTWCGNITICSKNGEKYEATLSVPTSLCVLNSKLSCSVWHGKFPYYLSYFYLPFQYHRKPSTGFMKEKKRMFLCSLLCTTLR